MTTLAISDKTQELQRQALEHQRATVDLMIQMGSIGLANSGDLIEARNNEEAVNSKRAHEIEASTEAVHKFVDALPLAEKVSFREQAPRIYRSSTEDHGPLGIEGVLGVEVESGTDHEALLKARLLRASLVWIPRGSSREFSARYPYFGTGVDIYPAFIIGQKPMVDDSYQPGEVEILLAPAINTDHGRAPIVRALTNLSILERMDSTARGKLDDPATAEEVSCLDTSHPGDFKAWVVAKDSPERQFELQWAKVKDDENSLVLLGDVHTITPDQISEYNMGVYGRLVAAVTGTEAVFEDTVGKLEQRSLAELTGVGE
jgi:hypothetical protein